MNTEQFLVQLVSIDRFFQDSLEFRNLKCCHWRKTKGPFDVKNAKMHWKNWRESYCERPSWVILMIELNMQRPKRISAWQWHNLNTKTSRCRTKEVKTMTKNFRQKMKILRCAAFYKPIWAIPAGSDLCYTQWSTRSSAVTQSCTTWRFNSQILEKLGKFDFHVKHHARKENSLADCFSRK